MSRSINDDFRDKVDRVSRMNAAWELIASSWGEGLAHFWLWELTPFPMVLPGDEDCSLARDIAYGRVSVDEVLLLAERSLEAAREA